MDELPPPVPNPDPLESQQPSTGPSTVAFMLGGIVVLCLLWILISVVSTDHSYASRDLGARQVMSEVCNAVRTHEARHGASPDSLDILCIPDGSHPPLLSRKEALTDLWGEPYRYRTVSTNKFEVRSSGPDKRMDTADDLTN